MQILDRIGSDMGIKQSVEDGLRWAFTVNHAAPNGLYQLHVYRVDAATKAATGRLTA